MYSPELFFRRPEFIYTLQQVIEFLGTFAFAISGIRHAAAKKSTGLEVLYVALP